MAGIKGGFQKQLKQNKEYSMSKPHKKIYMAAGYNTISMGTGRSEFNPKKARPGLEYYFKEAARGTMKQIGGRKNVDECVVGNFMASRFNKQAHLGGFFPSG